MQGIFTEVGASLGIVLRVSCHTCACGRRSVPVPSSHCILLLNVDSGGGGGYWGAPACLSEKNADQLHINEVKKF